MITAVDITANGNVLSYQITAVDQLVIPVTEREFYKTHFSGGGGESGGVSSGGGSTVSVASEVYVSLGGSDSAAQSFDATPAYTRVVNCVPFFAKSSFTGLVRVWLWSRNGGVTITARLWDVTAAASVGSASTTGTSRPASPQTFNAAIVSGNQYQLEIITSVASEDGYGFGTLVNA
jgi:hypothetical protein